ncbi:hypothetical protein BU26DRAFT_524985 [Trematosphaeria pertusa]|uniref:Protein kinase domain-containing protein n=1 Tax=Trematosphaeria pertusa TaxID=390896 RepID=A0A6A6HVS5_9PLEO|nr:uncharacterized protein BU26DRAFT_524985 [Trematosphaeria pertusa]KAF2241858.1 hypothetical protein BU26DRAFT_524985 [Trematosphaeria pertusa]
MDSPSPDYKQLFLEEQRLWQEAKRARQEAERGLQEAERARQEAERARQEAERGLQEAKRARQEAERAIQKTTLPEFLDVCHVHLHSNLAVQTDPYLSTEGDPSNANDKVRPEEIRVWEDFPEQQEKMWQLLVDADFIQQRHFTSIHTLQELGPNILHRKLASELDLYLFERSTAEDPTSLILNRIYADPHLRRKYNLRGSVKFENHDNTLSPEAEVERGTEQMDISGQSRRRSPRLRERERAIDIVGESAGSGASPPAGKWKFARPRADQFCAYNMSGDATNSGSRTAIFVIEYKPPYKLTLNHIYEGLEDMKLEDVVISKDTDGSKELCRRLLAATITQAFSYMIMAGLEFGCVRTGEASIFLRAPEDPRTVYYFLSVPKNDVGESTGWDLEGDSDNRLHLTAVGQMLAFTLQALQTTPRSHSWRSDALSNLPKWNVIYNEVLEAIPVDEVDGSEYQPSPHSELIRASPIRLRHRPRRRSSSPKSTRAERKSQPSTSTSNRSVSGARQHCTHECLLGLLNGGALDQACPNTPEHGRGHHQIGHKKFLALLREQLSKTMDENFDPASRPGSRGVCFTVTLASHGYTFAAKCSPYWFAKDLEYEASVYQCLRPIQGRYIPVCLGHLELPQPYYSEIPTLTHALLLSYGGTPTSRHVNASNMERLLYQAEACLKAIHAHGVRHCDALCRNVLLDTSTGRVMVIDFERAKIERPRPGLGRDETVSPKLSDHPPSEGGQLRAELQDLVKAAGGNRHTAPDRRTGVL